MSLNSGVYCITNKLDGKVYVGSSFNLKKRLYEHKRQLSKGTHRNKHLQSAYDKFSEFFNFEVIVIAAGKDYVLETEKRIILAFNSHMREFGYNKSTETHANLLGYKHDAAYSARVAADKTGNTYRLGAVIPDEMRKRISDKLKGRLLSAETRAKMSATRLGVPQRPEWIAKRTAAAKATKLRKLILNGGSE